MSLCVCPHFSVFAVCCWVNFSASAFSIVSGQYCRPVVVLTVLRHTYMELTLADILSLSRIMHIYIVLFSV